MDLKGGMNKECIHRNLKEINDEFFLDIETNEVVMIWYKKDDTVSGYLRT